MKSQVLSSFAWIDLTILAFLIFICLFSFVIFWVFRKGSKKFYQEVSSLPLKEAKEISGETGDKDEYEE